MYNGFMHTEDTNPIFNDIAKAIIAKGGKIDVYRVGRGIQGSFKRIEPASTGYRWDPAASQPLPRAIHPGFWCIHHSRGTEMLINGDYQKLEIQKVNDGVYLVMIPA
jgi:hypothetical protein